MSPRLKDWLPVSLAYAYMFGSLLNGAVCIIGWVAEPSVDILAVIFGNIPVGLACMFVDSKWNPAS